MVECNFRKSFALGHQKRLQCIQSVVLDVPNLSEIHGFADVEHSFTGEVVQRGRRSTKLVRYHGLGMQIATDLVG